MIGIFTAAARGEDGKAIRLDEIGGVGAGAGGIKRRMLQKPDKFVGLAAGDGRNFALHFVDRQSVRDETVRDSPANGRRTGDGQHICLDIRACEHEKVLSTAFSQNGGTAATPAFPGFLHIGWARVIFNFKKLSRRSCAPKILLLHAPPSAQVDAYHDAVVAELVDAQR